MKKSVLFSLMLWSSFLVVAQTPQYFNSAAGTGQNAYPLNSTIYNKAQWIFGPNEFNAAGTGVGTAAFTGNITTIFVRFGNSVSTSTPYTNLVISLSQNVGTSTSFGTVPITTQNFVTGMTPCFSPAAGYTLAGATANSWYGFNLTSSFPYNPNLSLVVEIKVQSGSPGGSLNNLRLTNGTTPQRLYGAFSSSTATNATGKLNFGFNMIPTPLPVSLTRFDGFKELKADILKWTTTCEINNAGFNVQHATDGIHFSTIENVSSKAPNGNCSTSIAYEVTNAKPAIGHNYYRLEQIDIDGRTSIHSNIVHLFRTMDGSSFVAYPNPSKSLVTLDMNMNDFSNLTINITDMNGRMVKQVKTNAQPGANQIPVDLYQLRSGNYMLQVVQHDELIFTTKVTKE